MIKIYIYYLITNLILECFNPTADMSSAARFAIQLFLLNSTLSDH